MMYIIVSKRIALNNFIWHKFQYCYITTAIHLFALTFAVNSLVAEFTDSAPLIHDVTQWHTMLSEFHAHSILTYLFPSMQLNVIPSYSVSLQSCHFTNGLIQDFGLKPLCIWDLRSWLLHCVGFLSQTFRESVWVPSSRFKQSKRNCVLTVEGWTYTFSEAAVTKQSTLRSNSEVRRTRVV